MNLLILNNDAQDYLKILEPKYPEVTIHAAENEEAIGSFIEQTDILLTIHVSDELIKKAGKLKWVQAMTTGTDYPGALHFRRKSPAVFERRKNSPYQFD